MVQGLEMGRTAQTFSQTGVRADERREEVAGSKASQVRSKDVAGNISEVTEAA